MDSLGPVGMDRSGPVWDLLGCLAGFCWGFVGLFVVVLLDEQPTAMQPPVGSNPPQKTSKMEFVSVLVEFLMQNCWLGWLGEGEVYEHYQVDK
jgi:hypothetical protein